MAAKRLTKDDFVPRPATVLKPLPPPPSPEVRAARIAWLRKKIEEIGKKRETMEIIIARWRAILANRNTLPAIVTMARQALHNLGAGEAERVPGEDDEERAA